MADDLLTTQSGYAKHRGVSKQAVSKMVRENRIPTVMRGGKVMIDIAVADRALGANVQRISYSAPDDRDDAPLPGERPLRDAPASSSASSGLTKAKAMGEAYRTKMAQLDYEERIGRLIKIEEVQRSMERTAEIMVRAIDQLPTHADDIAAAFTRGGSADVRKHLKTLSRSMRSKLAENMRLLAAAETENEEGED